MKIKKDTVSLFYNDAKKKGISLRRYCKDYGIDYHDLTGFPRPCKDIQLNEEVENAKEARTTW